MSGMFDLAGAVQQRAAGMRGFASEFRDLEHYIRVITDRIWEGGRIEDIRTYYSDPCIVETPAGVSSSVQEVIDGTRATLAMFPDRRLLAEDVIQSGDDQGGFLSSHRIISTMTHRGDGAFGAASGRRVHARTVADCVCRNNQVVHEWLVRDQAAIARQIGWEPQDLAQAWLDQRGGWTKPVAGPAPAGYRSQIAAEARAQDYASALQDFATGANPGASVYDEALHHIGPGETTRYGRSEVQDFWRSLFETLQVESFQVEHLALNRGGPRADRLTLRWRAQTRHDNPGAAGGMFGTATGRPVELLGINHAEFVNGKVLREWVLIDEIALWMQILTARV